jgi:hypothetical protein
MVIRYIYEVTEAIVDKRLVEKKETNGRKKERDSYFGSKGSSGVLHTY